MAEPVLFHNARIHTVERLNPTAAWFTVLGDRFQRVGEGPPPDVRNRVDLGGRCVVPGFVDAHTHFFQTGLDMLFIDLSGARTVAEIGQRLLAKKGGRRSWVIAHSFDEENLTDVPRLLRTHLDEVCPERPVWVNRVDYHSAVVNSAALRRLELPIGMSGLLLSRSKEPLGVLRSEAYWQAKQVIGRLHSNDVKETAVKTAAKECIQHGVTAVHALEGGKIFGDEGVQTLLKRMQSLPLCVNLFIQEKNVIFTSRLGFRHLGGCILIDGSIGSYTAALDFDYAGQPGQRGVVYEKQREFETFVEEAHVEGTQLAFHALGPRAIELVLRAYERAQRKHPRHDHRHRIEHFELATDEHIKRARDLGVIASMQPSFEHFWGGPDGMYASRLGEAWRRTNRVRSALDADVVVAGGSDCNVTPPNPLLGIHAAVNHPNEEERISVEQALRMMTIDAAYAAFMEREHGSIAVGKDASFAVLDNDIFEQPKDKLSDIKVDETWYRGRRVYLSPHATRPSVPPPPPSTKGYDSNDGS